MSDCIIYINNMMISVCLADQWIMTVSDYMFSVALMLLHYHAS